MRDGSGRSHLMGAQLRWARVRDNSGMWARVRGDSGMSSSILERALRHIIKFLNKSGCASTWSAQKYEISKDRQPVPQSNFGNRPEANTIKGKIQISHVRSRSPASDNTVDRNLQLSNGCWVKTVSVAPSAGKCNADHCLSSCFGKR